jgi:hypothetical protein
MTFFEAGTSRCRQQIQRFSAAVVVDLSLLVIYNRIEFGKSGLRKEEQQKTYIDT